MDEQTRRLLQRGREHYGASEYDKAERLLLPLARDHHPFADVYAMLGFIYHHKGRLQDALVMFEEALRLNPAYTEAALNLAVTYNELGRYQEAKKSYERMVAARQENPNHLDSFVRGKIANMHADVGRAYEDTGLFDEAAHEYRRALALCPTFVDIRTRLGAALRSAGNLAGAEGELQQAKRQNALLVGPRLQLGLTHYTAGRYEDAGREWREVLAMDAANKFAKLYLRLLEDTPGGHTGPPGTI